MFSGAPHDVAGLSSALQAAYYSSIKRAANAMRTSSVNVSNMILAVVVAFFSAIWAQEIKPGYETIREWHFHPYFNPNDPLQGASFNPVHERQ